MKIESFIAERMQNVQSSAIRELLKQSQMDDVISLAGGIPAESLFDYAGLNAATQLVLAEKPQAAFQYGLTEGSVVLRESIAKLCAKRGIEAQAEDILVTAGSQQALDLIFRTLVNPQDIVVVERPSYLAALQALSISEAQIQSVGSDAEGLIVDELEELVKKQPIKAVYVVPTFANPTGTTMSLERRRQLVALAVEYQFIIIEDDPYGEIRFTDYRLPSLYEIAMSEYIDAHNFIYISSFSKILAPGLRIGWMVLSSVLRNKVTIVKQAADLHASAFSQAIVEYYLQLNRLDKQVSLIRENYRQKRDKLVELLTNELSDVLTFNEPTGGMFLWAKFKTRKNTTKLLNKCLQEGVVYVPGEYFFADNPDTSTLRLSYATATEAELEEAVRRLKRAL